MRRPAFPATWRELRGLFRVPELQLLRAPGVAAARLGRHKPRRATVTRDKCPAAPGGAAADARFPRPEPVWVSCLGLACALLFATGWPLAWLAALVEAVR